ncbi:MATE family membrane protein, Rfbx family [Halapricum desulfuricans]|uniref:MATE family membrane protein, Rfbx family n=1 Tax=Halapricum desulfuricans TaxID=2841257 RepID=A0A897NG90_9EURY|nr:lipopolysaccharide biosynthesis protein [Halapricum desulfuricans]QSG11361.1 MATE family membrane protein, Rfbx family [Halapricum desulfuricans]
MIRDHLRTAMRAVVPTGDLATRTARSGVWLTVTNISQRVLELIALLVLARLLTPADFGLLGIALLVLTGLDRFSQLGFSSALIQRHEENVDDYLDTAWTLQILRGIVLSGILLISAGPVATFFGAPTVEPILKVIAITPILAGLENPGVIYFQKDLQFHRQFLHLTSTTIVYVSVTIALALTWGNVWALVIGKVASELSNLGVSYLVHDYKPRLELDREAAWDLIGFGKWITASSIVRFMADEGDDFVVGWLLGPASLGFYRLAFRLGLTPASEVTGVIGTVMFPAYSKLQDDISAVRSAFFRTLQLVTAFTFPAGVGIIVVAPSFVEAVLGTQWLPMIAALQILSVYGLLLSLAGSFGPVWLALGRPDFSAKIGAVRFLVMAVLIYPATIRYGLVGTGGAVIAGFVFGALPIDLYVSRNLMNMSLGRFFRELSYPAVAAGCMGLAVWIVSETVVVESAIAELIVLILLGIAVYVLAAIVLVRGFGWSIEDDVRATVSALGG